MITFPNISPEIFSISVFGFDLALRWYALSYIVGFFIAISMMKFFIRREKLWRHGTAPMDLDQADALLTYMIIGVIFGGRLGYVLFYNFAYYIENLSDVLRIWDGGMSFHGGFLGVVFAIVFYCKKNGILVWSASDLIALSTPPGLFLGRVANFINAELWGRPTNSPLGVVFPGDRAQDCPDFSSPCARHPSQLYEAGLEGIILLLILLFIAFMGGLRRPKFVTGVFMAGYGAARFFVEFFRVPDSQFFSINNPYGFAYRIGDFGITMGQTLSLPMIIFGVLLVFSGLKIRAQDR